MSAHLNLAHTQIFLRLRSQTSSSTAIKTIFLQSSSWFHFQPNYHFLKQSPTISSESQDDRLWKYFCLSTEGPGREAGASRPGGILPALPPPPPSSWRARSYHLCQDWGRDPPPQGQASRHRVGRQGWWLGHTRERPEQETRSTRAGLL